jgi:hypothetical protein
MQESGSLWCYTNQNKRHGWNASAFPNEIVKLPFVIPDSGGHLLLQLLHWEDFDANVDNITWPAPGSEDTELGVFMGPEVRHGATKVYAGIQA